MELLRLLLHQSNVQKRHGMLCNYFYKMKQFFVFVLLSILVISISTLQANEVQEPSPFFAWSSSE